MNDAIDRRPHAAGKFRPVGLWLPSALVWLSLLGFNPTTAFGQRGDDPVDNRPLNSNLSPSALRQVLSRVEQDLAAAIVGGAAVDRARQFEAVRRAVDLKRQASQLLVDHPRATASDAATGRRGLLQSESHLASLGDLDAAKRLETLAADYLRDPSPDVRADAATVRVGLAIEQLQNGAPNASENLLTAVNDLQTTGEVLDIAALVSFGQAKQAFDQYGQIDSASQVAKIIEANFANHPDPQVRSMAQTIIGRGALVDLQRDLDTLRQSGDSPALTVESWRQTLDRLWREPDLSTVRLMANVGLELEANGRETFAAATYELLRTADPSSLPPAVTAEARGVIQAAAARAAVVGQPFAMDLATVSGGPIDLASLRGRLLIIPFWSAQYAASIEPLWPELQRLRQRYEDRVAVVGVNLDTAEFDPGEFLTRRGWNLPSWRAVSDPQAEVINQTAQRFGVSSLIYVLLVDGTGKIRRVNLSGEGLTDQVVALLNEI